MCRSDPVDGLVREMICPRKYIDQVKIGKNWIKYKSLLQGKTQ